MLIGCGVRAGGGPMRMLGAPLAGAIERNAWAHAGAVRNFHAGEATVGSSAKAGFPTGCLAPSSWSLPNKAGGMSSRFNATLAIAATGAAVGGVNIAGTSAMSFSAAAIGQLIAFGTGTASMTFAAAGLMAGVLQGQGAASFAITTNTPILGALAGGSGSASMTFGASANALPADDTPPARSAAASFAFSAAAVLTAIGHLNGSTENGGELTEAGIAAATVAALQATTIPVDVRQVRGQDLEGAGTELDPWGPA